MGGAGSMIGATNVRSNADWCAVVPLAGWLTLPGWFVLRGTLALPGSEV